jgi:hypothetical protein
MEDFLLDENKEEKDEKPEVELSASEKLRLLKEEDPVLDQSQEVQEVQTEEPDEVEPEEVQEKPKKKRKGPPKGGSFGPTVGGL